MSKPHRDNDYYPLAIALIAACLFIPFLGRVHLFDWDEINFAESAREMLMTKNYSRVLINYQPFWQKPPLFFWMQAICMKCFGINEFSARLPNAICGIISLLVLYQIGKKLFDKNFGLIWVLAFTGSFLPHFYFKSGVIDPWFNLFIFSGIWWMSKSSPTVLNTSLNYYHSQGKNFLIAGIFTGLAILTKGPVALLISFLAHTIFAIIHRIKITYFLRNTFLFLCTVSIISSLWYLPETLHHGLWFIREFIVYQIKLLTTQDAGHGGPFYYHFVVLLVGCFPASIFVFGIFKKDTSLSIPQAGFKKWMIILLILVLLIFSIVKTKIIHYSSLAYFPLTFLATLYINKIYYHKSEVKLYTLILIGVIGSIIGLAIISTPLVGLFPAAIIPYIKDRFAKANLDAVVEWHYLEMGIGLLYLIILFVSIVGLRMKRLKQSIVLLFVGSALVLQFILYDFVPKIEKYTQGAAIEFYEKLQGKDCYVDVLGFKSFAQLFYSGKPPVKNPLSLDKQWLLTGHIDKPVYFVSKITKADSYRQKYNLKELYRKNGFVFFVREPDK